MKLHECSGWSMLGESVTGATHLRANKPNQDALHAWSVETGNGLPLILAVSDGHGSAKCFRSDVGARRAVHAAVKELGQFQASQRGVSNLSAIKRAAEERLPQLITRRWQKAVRAHYKKNPFSTDEFDALEKQAGVSARRDVDAHLCLAYGATLLSVLVTQSFILYLQLGDGDILTVSETGEVTRPMPKDERLLGNETTSLAAPQAWRDFQCRFQAVAGSPPALILLSTDGYANSFRDETGFLAVGSDFLELLRSEGLSKVNQQLKHWLVEASQAGSGDDITVGIVCRMEALTVSHA